MDKDWGAEGVEVCTDGTYDHNYCDDCCHHGECLDCGAANPYFEGCSLDS